MGVVRTVAVLVGLVALGAAVGLLVAPGAVADSGIESAVEGTPVDTVAKLGLALVFGVLGLASGASRAATGKRSLPTPETVGVERSTAGAEVDRQLELVAEDDETSRQARARVRREVRSVALATLVDVEGIGEDEADRRLDDGSWTTDRRASAFLGGDDVDRPPLSIRLVDWLSADPTFTIRARATVDVLARRRDDA